MKTSSNIFRLFVIWLTTFQMAYLPVAVNAQEDSQKQLSINECNEDPAREWNSARNICVYKKQAVDDRQEYRECAKLESDEARKECHDNYAKKRAGDPKEYKESKLGMGVAAANAALAAINMFTKGGKSSNCTSKTIHAATAAAGVIAELYFKFMASKEFKKLKEKYRDETVNKDPFAAQKRAFDFLEDQQKAIASYAKKRKIGYMLLTAGYTAAAGFAIYEQFSQGACGGDEDGEKDGDGDQDGESDTQDEETFNKDKPIKEDPKGVTDKESAKSALAGIGSAIGSINLASPIAVFIIASISAVLSAKLMKAAANQEEEAKANAEKIAKIKKKFESSLGNFCPSGHEDMSEPRCFCYTTDGEKNMNRTNSETCQRLWSRDEKSLFAKAGSYGKSAPKKQGCMTKARQFDQQCKCKKFIDGNGQNACLKAVNNVASVPPNVQSAFSLPGIATALDSVNSGTSAGSVNAQSLSRSLAAATKARDNLIKKFNKVAKAKGQSQLPTGSQLLKKFLKKSGTRSFEAAGAKNPTIAAATPANPEIAKALKKAEKKSGIASVGKSSEALSSGGEKKKNGFNFNLDDGGNNVITMGEDPASDAEYDYGENDINEDSSKNLFDIISRRYNLSGLERLFDE